MKKYSSRFLWILLVGVLSIFIACEINLMPQASALLPPTCSPPSSGDWNVTLSCQLSTSASVTGNVSVQKNSVLTIPNGKTLRIDFTHKHLIVKSDGGVLVKAGGRILQGPIILLNPSSGLVGSAVNIAGNHFVSSSFISIKFNNVIQTTNPGIITTNSTGGFTGSISVPSSSLGPYSISATDTSSNTASSQFTVKPGISISPSNGLEGTTVTVNGTNFAANSHMIIKYDNTKIAFSSDRDGNREVYTMNADGTAQTRLTNNVQDDTNPSFSPNGTKIVFESGRLGHTQIFLMNENGTAQVQLKPDDGGFDMSPTFSPNGTRIVFFDTGLANNNQIYIVKTDGTGQTRLTNNAANDKYPVFSPNGTKIVFQSDRDGNNQIYIMNANGTDQTRLTNNAANDQHPSFSPDGTKIVFQTDRDANNEIYVMNTNGSGHTRLTNNAAEDQYPVFSTDGTKIVFQTDRDANNEIYVMNTNGSGQTPLSKNDASDTSPAFSTVSTPVTSSPSSITSSGTGTFLATFSVPSSAAGIHVINASDAALHSNSAQFTVLPSASILINPSSGLAGTTVTVNGTNFAANSHVTIKYNGTTVTTIPPSITSSGLGIFSATFTVSQSSAIGPHTINASDALAHSASIPFTVISPASISLSPSKGFTGISVIVGGTNFTAHSHITIKYDNTPVPTTPSVVNASAGGIFSASFSVPSSSVGLHTVSAYDNYTNSALKKFNVTGSGSGTFHMQSVLPQGTFNQPVKIVFIPDNGYGVDGSGNAFVTERAGNVMVMKNNNGTFVKQSIPFVTVPNVFSDFYEEGLAGIAFPPDYTSSHFVYFYAAIKFVNGTHAIQIMRYTVTTDGSQNLVAVPGSQKIILQFSDQGIGHFGGHIKFDSLGHLYIGTGDQWVFGNSQDTGVLQGKLLRITPLATPGIDGKYYSIPGSNPFANSMDGTRKEIFSYGLRHPYSFDLDSVSGKLYVDDVGLDTTEEIDDSTTPANFGWALYEGPIVGNPLNLVNYKNPLYYYYHADVEAPGGGFVAVTAGVFYHGSAYPSQFDGAYFFGDYGAGFIRALLPVEQYPPTMDPATGVPIAQVASVTSGHPGIPVGFAVWHGEIYYTDYNFPGAIGKITFS